MKDIVITSKRIRKELLILLGCFIFAVLFDAFAVIKYGKPAFEVIQTIGYEIVIAVGTYLILAVIRLVIYGLVCLFRRKK